MKILIEDDIEFECDAITVRFTGNNPEILMDKSQKLVNEALGRREFFIYDRGSVQDIRMMDDESILYSINVIIGDASA